MVDNTPMGLSLSVDQIDSGCVYCLRNDRAM